MCCCGLLLLGLFVVGAVCRCLRLLLFAADCSRCMSLPVVILCCCCLLCVAVVLVWVLSRAVAVFVIAWYGLL